MKNFLIVLIEFFNLLLNLKCFSLGFCKNLFDFCEWRCFKSESKDWKCVYEIEENNTEDFDNSIVNNYV